jgi:hypothetical protein
MAKKKGNKKESESNRCRITCERSLNYDNIAEILVYEYSIWKMNLFHDETDVLVAVIPHDSSPLYHPLPQPFTKR